MLAEEMSRHRKHPLPDTPRKVLVFLPVWVNAARFGYVLAQMPFLVVKAVLELRRA